MPNKSKVQLRANAAIRARLENKRKRSASESDVRDQIDAGIFDVNDQESELIDSVFTCDRSVQVQQTERTAAYVKFIKSEQSLKLLGDLVSLLIDETRVHLKERLISVIIFKLLKFVGAKFEVIRAILERLDCHSINSAHKWAFMVEDDVSSILSNQKGKYEREFFYDLFPEIEMVAKAFALEKTQQKTCAFSVLELAKFITQQFIEQGWGNVPEGELVLSESSCRADLVRWGATWCSNSKRPYF